MVGSYGSMANNLDTMAQGTCEVILKRIKIGWGQRRPKADRTGRCTVLWLIYIAFNHSSDGPNELLILELGGTTYCVCEFI